MLKVTFRLPEVIEKQQDIKIVYTPIHGTGITLVRSHLKNLASEM
jgi:phosphoglucomutase